MDFEILGCEAFGYDNNMRPTGQVSMQVEPCNLRFTGELPRATTKAQVVMFLMVGEKQMNLYSAMMPVEAGKVVME
jgi:hypothetical protein